MKPLAAFRLPLELCPPQNRTRGAGARALGRIKRQCWGLMLAQYIRQMGRTPPALHLHPPMVELVGRRVVCTRHSSVEPDRWSDFGKIPVDLLCVPRARRRRGLCLIWDDAPKHALIEQRWEQAPKGHGWVDVEVFER